MQPEEFIPLAEDTGLISTIGEWVLEAAFSQAVDWLREGLPSLRIAVNVSSHQIKDPGFVEVVRCCLEETGIDAARVELEVTESALIRDDENA